MHGVIFEEFIENQKEDHIQQLELEKQARDQVEEEEKYLSIKWDVSLYNFPRLIYLTLLPLLNPNWTVSPDSVLVIWTIWSLDIWSLQLWTVGTPFIILKSEQFYNFINIILHEKT